MKFVLKNVVLQLIPHRIIRWVKKKLNTDYFFFGGAKKNIGRYLVLEEQAECPLYNMEQNLGEEVVEGFKSCFADYEGHPGLLRKYILEVNDCIIEPTQGWAITYTKNELIFDSISNNSWRENYHPDYFQFKRNKNSATLLNEVVSINMIQGGENNYWHFIHDLLGEVALALKHISPGVPFLISRNFYDRPFFQQALQQSPILARLNWMVRDEQYFRVKKAWFIQTMLNSNEQFLDVRDLLQVPDAETTKERKIFLTRSTQRIRHLKNKQEIEEMARRFGFEVIDTDGMTLQSQIILFSETKWLVAIHGAGLTNVIFRKGSPMNVLELLPKNYLQPHYFWLSKGMGHHYQAMVGTSTAIDSSFEINPNEFESNLESMLSGVTID